MCRNPIQKEFLKSHDGLLSHQLTSAGQSTNWAVFFGACLVSPQKAIVQFQKFFFIALLHISRTKYVFSREVSFSYHFNPYSHTVICLAQFLPKHVEKC